MGFVDGPLRGVLEKEAKGAKELLKVRAWEVAESPTDLGYRPVEGWPRLPEGWKLGQVAGVATDSRGRYYIYHRGDQAPPIICFDREGELIALWGEGSFSRPHMIKCDRDDNLWAVDDGSHVLYLYSPQGEMLRNLGAKDAPGEDGGHFNRPTDIAFCKDGGFYVSDGYGNRRVARFDRELKFLGQWGSEGEGQFVLPHAVTTDPEGLVYVADRTKWRVEVFTPEGGFLGQWSHIGKPFGIVYADDDCFYVCDGDNARVTKLDGSGRIVGFFGEKGSSPGQLSTAHDIAVAENGDILTAHLDGRVQLFSLS